MGGDVLRGVEILREQRGRHDERCAGVREALARRAVHGELARRVERLDAREVAEGVGELRVREAAQHDGAGVAGTGQRDFVECAAHPRDELGLLRAGELRLVLGRHLTEFELLLNLLPDLRVALHGVEGLKALEVEVALVVLGRVALEAELVQQGADVLLKVCGRPARRAGEEQQGGEQQEQDRSLHRHWGVIRGGDEGTSLEVPLASPAGVQQLQHRLAHGLADEPVGLGVGVPMIALA